MTVRRGRPADEPTIRSLQSLLREPSPSLVTHALHSGGVLVDCAGGPDGPPVGYLLAVDGDGAHIAELAVAPDHRREGRATRLLTRLLDGADGTVTLYVAADNEAARRLYARLGFRQRARRPAFYDDGTDALVLACDPGQVDER
ncbi:GNAT family N-acetyltransferase [Halobaculum limi]|uniref:GNAT family N-acetyltransferase n=1 Tax=Halobaculum limi TaxID=3031916 RepID=UPI002406F411|nr:N-acetyltransferase [Halobaculum sp. YSMS11]